MFQIRIHGRGGQGVVTAAEILSIAAFLEGKHAQAFPTFGSERMGAPVMAFCRIDNHPIRLREPVMEPNALIIQDSTLLHRVPLFDGLMDPAYVLVNTTRSFSELGLMESARPLVPESCCSVPATSIGLQHIGRPIPNSALLGAFAGLSGIVTMESLATAIRKKFPGIIAERNVAAARAGYRLTLERSAKYVSAD